MADDEGEDEAHPGEEIGEDRWSVPSKKKMLIYACFEPPKPGFMVKKTSEALELGPPDIILKKIGGAGDDRPRENIVSVDAGDGKLIPFWRLRPIW